MKILVLRTDNPQAEIGLFNDGNEVLLTSWEAHRRLAETLHDMITSVCGQSGVPLDSIEGIIVYQGPGSFTGLRIGLSVANAIAASYDIPIVGATGEQWIHDGHTQLAAHEAKSIVLPIYGSPVHITAPKK